MVIQLVFAQANFYVPVQMHDIFFLSFACLVSSMLRSYSFPR